MIDNLTEAINHAKEERKKVDKTLKYWESINAPLSEQVKYEIGQCKDKLIQCDQTIAWLTELQERREADKWVNAKERKPEKDGAYLVVVEFQHILLVTYYDAENEHWGTANDVIAWRPLPEYKESEDK